MDALPPSDYFSPFRKGSTVVARIGAIDHRQFAGKLDRSQLGLLERAMVRAVHAPDGDFRDWEEVSLWAAQIAETLMAAASTESRRAP